MLNAERVSTTSQLEIFSVYMAKTPTSLLQVKKETSQVFVDLDGMIGVTLEKRNTSSLLTNNFLVE